jgi:hypothetical protein
LLMVTIIYKKDKTQKEHITYQLNLLFRYLSTTTFTESVLL